MNITMEYVRIKVGKVEKLQLKLTVIVGDKRTILTVDPDSEGSVGSVIDMPDGRTIWTTKENCAPGGDNSFDALVNACGINPTKHLWPMLAHLRCMDAEVVKHEKAVADMDRSLAKDGLKRGEHGPVPLNE